MRIAALLLLLTASLPAAAEEGLFVTRLSAGVSAYDLLEPRIGVALNGSADLGLTDRIGVLGAAFVQLHDGLTIAGIGIGLQLMIVQTLWHRLYLNASPALLLEWVGRAKPRFDVAARVGVGYEYLFMWGLGMVIEVHGTFGAGLGLDVDGPIDHAFAGASAGLFMEF